MSSLPSSSTPSIGGGSFTSDTAQNGHILKPTGKQWEAIKTKKALGHWVREHSKKIRYDEWDPECDFNSIWTYFQSVCKGAAAVRRNHLLLPWKQLSDELRLQIKKRALHLYPMLKEYDNFWLVDRMCSSILYVRIDSERMNGFKSFTLRQQGGDSRVEVIQRFNEMQREKKRSLTLQREMARGPEQRAPVPRGECRSGSLDIILNLYD